MQNFQYLIGCDQAREVAVVDPAWDPDLLLKTAAEEEVSIVMVLLTHGHPDHINAADEIAERLSVPVLLSADEGTWYLPSTPRLVRIKDQETIPIGQVTLTAIATPGHTPGCMCFLTDRVLLTGDVLFVNACGRCDLHGSDPEAMYYSLYEVLLPLPDDTVIYPGHRYGRALSDTLGHQKQRNPYLTCRSKEEFLKDRMGC